MFSSTKTKSWINLTSLEASLHYKRESRQKHPELLELRTQKNITKTQSIPSGKFNSTSVVQHITECLITLGTKGLLNLT